MPYELCRHVKANGRRCQSPCLSDKNWCFFHARLHFRHRSFREAKPQNSPTPLIMPVIEDRESIQVAASLVVAALASGHIDDKRAAAILRALQLASRNLAGGVEIAPKPDWIVRSYVPTLDGLELAARTMSDSSTPPKLEPRDPSHPPS
jgi:hypothetical protein